MPSNHRQSPPRAKEGPRSHSDALQQESARVLAEVQAPLKDLVTVRLQRSNDLHEAVQLMLTLHFTNTSHPSNLWRVFSRNGGNAERISAALAAITLVYTHSRLLISHGKPHADFWTQLLTSKVIATEASEDIRTWMATEMGDTKHFSLRMVLDFGGSKRSKIDKKWLDAVYMFMTESPECSKMFERRDCRKKNTSQARILFGLSFANARLTTKCHLKIQRLLECAAPGCNRHYGIDLLDFSHNAMNAEQLAIVTQILKRNHVYQVQDIRLEETVRSPLNKSDSRILRRTSAFDLSRTTTEWQSDIRATIPTISLATNLLGAQHVISVCSALRYGCAFEELSLTSMINLVDPSERELCWRWLAFGIFYPRSKRFADQFKLRKIKLLATDITSAGVEALANTLYNPVAEFRRSGLPEDKFAMDAVLIGVVEKGATVYSTADARSMPLLRLVRHQELEILHSHHDTEWVCVVVAGVGLGWLRTAHVLSVEHDLEKHESPGDAHFDLVVRNSPAHAQKRMPRDTHTFIETIGKHLRSLSVRDSGRLSLVKIIYYCKNIVHLDLEGCDLRGESLRDLLRCLRSHLGRQIVSLNLNRTCVSDDDMAKLAELLGDPKDLRNLKELRVYKIQVTPVGLDSLYSSLIENRTLTTLELGQLGDDFDRLEKRARGARIRATRRNEQLSIVPVSLNQRIAFLSAVLDPRSKIKEAAKALRTSAFQLIFQFAKEPDRRTIRWVTPRDRWLGRREVVSASRSTVSKRWQTENLPLLKFLKEM